MFQHHKLFGGNGTCPLPKNEADLLLTGEPVVGSFTSQHLMFIISIACAGITVLISLLLITKHLHRYTVPREQRQVIRMIFTPVVFSFLSAMSILDYHVAQYMIPLTHLYEAFGLCALFLLFVEYVAPDPNTRDSYFANLENRKSEGTMLKPSDEYSVVPGGSLRWFKMKWVIVFAYLFAEIVMTIVQEASQATGTYCPTSLAPRFAHFWVFVIENVALALAALSILKYYGRMKKDPAFARHKPLLKLVSFKLIVGVNFIQDFIFNILVGKQVIHGSTKMTGLDLTYGLPATLVAVEQVIFAIFFHYAFRSREYHESVKIDMKRSRMGTLHAAAHAANPLDYIIGFGTAIRMLSGGLGAREDEAWNDAPQPTRLQNTRYGRVGHDDLSYMGSIPGNKNSPYEPSRHTNPAVPTSYQPVYHPPPQYGHVDDETTRLTPGHVYGHSRESSMDRYAPNTRQVV